VISSAKADSRSVGRNSAAQRAAPAVQTVCHKRSSRDPDAAPHQHAEAASFGQGKWLIDAREKILRLAKVRCISALPPRPLILALNGQ